MNNRHSQGRPFSGLGMAHEPDGQLSKGNSKDLDLCSTLPLSIVMNPTRCDLSRRSHSPLRGNEHPSVLTCEADQRRSGVPLLKVATLGLPSASDYPDPVVT